jgi:UDP-hydrolysing UDP-N-acetyl-D-glucosamine 2-epimerase
MLNNRVFEFVVTARPSWSRVKSLINEFIAISNEKNVNITLLGPSLSKNYGNIKNQMPSGVTLKAFKTLFYDDSLSSITLSSLEGARSLVSSWENKTPDAVLVIADRTETLGVSLAAATMQIPLIHLQGGEISGSIDDKIRDANSKLADFHLTTNSYTYSNLIKLGENKDNIRIIGCPSIDIVKNRLSRGSPLKRYASDYGGVGYDFDTNSEFGLILFHPDTLNSMCNLEWINEILKLTYASDLNWFWFWPNTDFGSEKISKLLRTARENESNSKVRYLVNLPPEDFIDLSINSKILIGNSSFGIREASYLGLPVINLGNRQKGRQRADNVLDIYEPTSIYPDFKKQIGQIFKSSDLYGNGNSGKLGAEALNLWLPRIKTR